MSEVDRQRIAAVRALEALGHCFRDGRWQPPIQPQCCPEADALHSLLVSRADTLIGCTAGSTDQDELEALVRRSRPMRPCDGPPGGSMAERVSENQDLLREHWWSRRARIQGELRGMDAGLEVLPNNPGGEEVRVIIQGKADELRAELQRLEGYLGPHEVAAS
jgi:hypothetical protein